MFVIRVIRKSVSSIVNARLRFERHGNSTVGRDVEGLQHVALEGRNAIGRGTIFARQVDIGFATTVGANCYIHGPASIGRYCQLGPAVGIYGSEHTTSGLTTYVNKTLVDMLGGQCLPRIDAGVRVGHDVWIGHGTVLLKGVHVGHGAVIGAGAVVTAAVPEYSVVAGVPARKLRSRFPASVVDLLLELEWWSLREEDLRSIRHLFALDFNTDTERSESLLRESIGNLPPAWDRSY